MRLTSLVMRNKGFFATTIIALLLFIIISLLAIRIEQKNYINETVEDYTSTLNLVYERTNFEYNLKNALKTKLDNEIKINQNENIVKPIVNNFLQTMLLDYNISNTFSSILAIYQTNCGILDCAYYEYTITTPIEKEVQYKNKKINVAIPQNYSMKGRVIIS